MWFAERVRRELSRNCEIRNWDMVVFTICRLVYIVRTELPCSSSSYKNTVLK